MAPRRSTRDLYSWTEVRLPERSLSESVLDLAAPLLERLGSDPAPAEARATIAYAIEIWNAHVTAAPYWRHANPKPLAALRKAAGDKHAAPDLAERFALLSARWQKEFKFDPRLVGDWSFEENASGVAKLLCETRLPEGVRARVPPPAEKRIAIGGRFLDEVSIRQSPTSRISFPVESHSAVVAGDGTVTVRAKVLTALQLFADGVLNPIGAAPVAVQIGMSDAQPMVLTALSCTDYGGHRDFAVLVFRPTAASSDN